MAARKRTVYLIYRASDDSLRVNNKSPRLCWDEIAFTAPYLVGSGDPLVWHVTGQPRRGPGPTLEYVDKRAGVEVPD